MIIFRKLFRQIRALRMKSSSFDLEQFAYSQTTSKPTSYNQPTQTQNNQKTGKTKKNPIMEERVTVLTKILEWRKSNQAPVDTMGCERLADRNAPIQIQKFQTLVSLMLSIQTKDETTFMIVNRLKQKGLTPSNIAKMPEQQLIEFIYQSNFNKRKAANLIAVSRIILQQGRIGNTKEELLAYPGVGIKIAMLYLKVAEGNAEEGIGVDTHVHRISNRLGWVKTNAPQETEQQLKEAFPVKYWKDINIGLVGFGQLRCQAKKPLCKGCPVENQCPSSKYSW